MKNTHVILVIAITMLLAIGTVSAAPVTPSCDFTASSTEGVGSLNVTFTATYAGMTPPVTYEWDFGDSSGALKVSGASITHHYATPGKYDVRLAVNDLGIPTTTWVSNTKSEFIWIKHPAPVAGFTTTFDPENPGHNSPLDVTFSSTTTGYDYELHWLLGDGSEDTRSTFTRTFYNDAGIPKLISNTLVATNEGGSNSESQSFTINPPAPTADFRTDSSTVGAVPLAVQFVAMPTGDGAMTYKWNFGDTHTSTEVNPLHAYGFIGLFDVTLTVTTPYGTDTITKEDYVNVTAVLPPVVCPEPTIVPGVTYAPSHAGIYNSGAWYIDSNGNGLWDAGTETVKIFGAAGWIPMQGNWNNGLAGDEIGIYKDGIWYIDYNGDGAWTDGIDKSYSFGAPDWVPVKGDWNADGTDEVGVYRDGYWYIDYNGNGVWNAGIDRSFSFGTIGWQPVVTKGENPT